MFLSFVQYLLLKIKTIFLLFTIPKIGKYISSIGV